MQVINHTFFWESLSPSGGGKPSGKVGVWERQGARAGQQRVWAAGAPWAGCKEGGTRQLPLVSSSTTPTTRPPSCSPRHPSPQHLPRIPPTCRQVAEAIDRDLGGYDKFVEAFKVAGEPS
mgnify:CR=1 FL=1